MAARTEGSSDLPAIEARASLYWTAALPLLERLQRNQTIRAPHTRLFEYQGQVLTLYFFCPLNNFFVTQQFLMIFSKICELMLVLLCDENYEADVLTVVLIV